MKFTTEERMEDQEKQQRMPTPKLSHFNAADYRKVYEPASDTFLFLDSLEKELPFLISLQPSICVEVGYVSS